MNSASNKSKPTMLLSHYIKLIKKLYQLQLREVKNTGKTTGFDDKVYTYNSTEEYKMTVKENLTSWVKNNDLDADITIEEALSELENPFAKL